MQETAYDLSLFEARRAPRERKSKTDEIKVVKGKGKAISKKKGLFSKIVVFGVFVILISTLIYSKVELTEVGEDITSQQALLAELQGEATRLELELEGKTSFGTIEEYATEHLGLSKVSSAQIKYIDLSEGNKIESLGDVGLASLWAKLKTAVISFVEYKRF